MERRFVMFGGGLSEEQLGWLRSELGSCRSSRQRAILFCHLPLHPGTCSPTCLLWNYEDVLATVDSFADVCMATFAGHAHWVDLSSHLLINFAFDLCSCYKKQCKPLFPWVQIVRYICQNCNAHFMNPSWHDFGPWLHEDGDQTHHI